MSVSVFLVAGFIACCLASYAVRKEPADTGITIEKVKKDTVYREMTPLRFLESNDQKKVGVVFSESPRFYYIRLRDRNTMEQTRAEWNKWIAAKTRLRIGFTEDQDGDAVIVTVKQ